MRIIYMHHAQRDIGEFHRDPVKCQEEDITRLGMEECEIIGKQLGSEVYNIKAIVSSPYKRCMHTAEIVNKYLNVPIIEDARFNEVDSTFPECWKRVMSGIDDIVKNPNYKEDEDILVVTSGVNITGFICYFYNIDPDNCPSFSQGSCTSPVNFIVEGGKGV